MLRIRFHGRGGQGMKTASRIVGTAAFREEHYAQDSPVYGAERRGAPMAAFTRIDGSPILERGMIAIPDLVVVADDTLFDDPTARPLHGITPAGAVLVNSTCSPETLRLSYDISGPLAVMDCTALALAHVGSLAALSVALGAAACQIAGLRQASMEWAVREELQALGLDPGHLQKNLGLARICYEEIVILPPAMGGDAGSLVRVPTSRVVTPSYQGPWRGTPSVAGPPNSPLRQTGNWRVWRPVIDLSRCTQCWLCFVSCPDGAIALDAADNPHVDYAVCKGCMICAEECPTHTIHTLREAEV